MLTWAETHLIQLLFLTGYLSLIAYHGWRGHQRSRSLDGFLIGGGSLGGTVIALSFYATFVSSVTFIGHAGRSYVRGPGWWVTCMIVFTVMILLSWFVVGPPFMRMSKRLKVLTIPEFLGKRYASRLLRRFAGVVVVLASLPYVTAVYDGAARTLESFLELDVRVVMALIFVVVTTYTLSGGFHSVVATDAVQGLILFAGAVILPATMIARKGGLQPLLASVRSAEPTALDWSGELSWIAMLGLTVGVGFKFIVEPRQLSRFYGLSSHEQLRRARWIAPTLLVLTYFCILPVGFLAHAFVPAGKKLASDEVVPYLLGAEANVLGPYLGALFLTALAAAAMSSLDSVLLVASSSIDHDVIAPEREERAAIRRTRIWIVVLSAAAAGMALARARGIVEMSSFSGSIFASSFLPALVIGLFWRRATRAGALTSMLLGFCVTLAWFLSKRSVLGGRLAHFHEVYLGLTISTAAYFLVSRFTQKSLENGYAQASFGFADDRRPTDGD